MQPQFLSDRASDVRYALEVLDEYSHLGLDEEYASKLREILERQLEATGGTVSCRPAEAIRFPGPLE